MLTAAVGFTFLAVCASLLFGLAYLIPRRYGDIEQRVGLVFAWMLGAVLVFCAAEVVGTVVLEVLRAAGAR